MLWWWLLVGYGVGAIAYAVMTAGLVRAWAAAHERDAEEPWVPGAVRALIVICSVAWPVLFVQSVFTFGRGMARGR